MNKNGGLDITLCLGCAVAKCVRGHSFPIFCKSYNSVCMALDPEKIRTCDDAALDALAERQYIEHTSEYINKDFIKMVFEFERNVVECCTFAAIDYTERG